MYLSQLQLLMEPAFASTGRPLVSGKMIHTCPPTERRSTVEPKTTVTCADCGEHRPHNGRGLCGPCYVRNQRAGTLDRFPPLSRPTSKSVLPLAPQKLIRCVECNKMGLRGGRGLCKTCYSRNRRAETLDTAYPKASAKPQRYRTSGTCLDCEQVHLLVARGLCSSCYASNRYYGSLGLFERSTTTVQGHVLEFTKAYGPDGCWPWPHSLDKDGYGQHRAFYRRLVGPVPLGLELDHLCRNRACVNPKHLEPVTHEVNQLRGDTWRAQALTRTHCPQKHEYTPENTLTTKTGRACKRCANARSAAYKRARRRGVPYVDPFAA